MRRTRAHGVSWFTLPDETGNNCGPQQKVRRLCFSICDADRACPQAKRARKLSAKAEAANIFPGMMHFTFDGAMLIFTSDVGRERIETNWEEAESFEQLDGAAAVQDPSKCNAHRIITNDSTSRHDNQFARGTSFAAGSGTPQSNQ